MSALSVLRITGFDIKFTGMMLSEVFSMHCEDLTVI